MKRTFAILLCLAGLAHAGAAGPDFRSDFLALGFDRTTPAFSWFGVDSLGRGDLKADVILEEKLPKGDFTFASNGGGKFEYSQSLPGGKTSVAWQIVASEKRIILRSLYVEGAMAPPFLLLVDQRKDHATVLGHLLPEMGRMSLPAVLHLPDMGTFRVTATPAAATLQLDARRRQPQNFMSVAFPAATKEQKAVEYTLDVTTIHPDLPGLDANPLYEGYRRDFLNLIQIHPRMGTLANNSSSDACGFCFWGYSELARKAPPLAPGLTVLDLIRMSMDRIFAGGITYGQAGYKKSHQNPEAAPWSPPFDSLDTLPSFLIAGSQYILASGDQKWGGEHWDQLAAMARKMIAQDSDGNGLIEYPLSGDSGSWGRGTRPANWWDTIGFGYEDAYSNALAYRGLRFMSEAAGRLGKTADAADFTIAADKIQKSYYPTFYDPKTGVLAGWKSKDGKLHDYYFTFVNGMAISFGLVGKREANAIMDKMLKKMTDVGYTRFDLGLPGNLVPVRKEDYTSSQKRFGGPTKDDGSDGFQIYENGAATSCHAYWTIKALYDLGRTNDARKIFYPMLRSYATGGFQGFGPNGMSKDWRDWKGGCNGYEGYLVDGYLALLAVEDDLKAGK